MKRYILLFFLFNTFLYLFSQESTLYFVRPNNFAGKALNIKLLINSTEITQMPNKSNYVYKTTITGSIKIEIKAFGTPSKEIKLNIENNKSYYFRLGFTTLGKYIEQVKLADVKNEIPELQDDVEEKTNKVIVNKDKKPPKILMINPKVTRGFKLSQESDQIKITGKVSDESGVFRLTINGTNTPYDADGNFQSLQSLNLGNNTIIVKAIDTQENTSEFIFYVDCTLKPEISSEIIKPNEKRVALVIGNADYKNSPLRNPVNDATLMTSELKKLGFNVNTIKNGSQNQMKQAISKFGETLAKDKSTIGLFYYAGHGLQIKGKNYLIPTDAKIDKEPDVEVYCVDLDGLLANLEYSGNNMNIIILDACRNNPFARSFRSQAGDGLATINAPVGTIIAYATAPGSVAADGESKNGLYTQEFVKALSIPNIKIEDVFKKVRTQVKTISEGKQIPWENSSIEGDFYFIRQK